MNKVMMSRSLSELTYPNKQSVQGAIREAELRASFKFKTLSASLEEDCPCSKFNKLVEIAQHQFSLSVDRNKLP